MKRSRIAAVVALCAVLVAGCASNNGPVDLANVGAAQPPLPGGVLTGKAAVPAATQAVNCQNATASLAPPAQLPPPGQMPAGSTMQKIQQRGHLVVGVDQNTYLFGYRSPRDNTLQGFDIDMANDVAKAIFGTSANKVIFKAITSAQRIDALQKGQVDMVARTFTITCARLQQVAFSSVYYQAQRRLLVRANSGITGIAGMGGKRVCATSGSDSLSLGQGQRNAPIPVAVNDWSDCLVMLQQGQVDGIVTDDTILAGLALQDPNTKIVGDSIASEPYGLAFPKSNSDFVSFVNGVLQQIRSDGEWTASYNKWIGTLLGATPAPPQPTYSN